MVEGKMEGKGGLTFKKFLIDLSFQVNMTHISNSSNISKGEMTWPSGDQYIGDWVNNQRLIVQKIDIFWKLDHSVERRHENPSRCLFLI